MSCLNPRACGSLLMQLKFSRSGRSRLPFSRRAVSLGMSSSFAGFSATKRHGSSTGVTHYLSIWPLHSDGQCQILPFPCCHFPGQPISGCPIFDPQPNGSPTTKPRSPPGLGFVSSSQVTQLPRLRQRSPPPPQQNRGKAGAQSGPVGLLGVGGDRFRQKRKFPSWLPAILLAFSPFSV